jgi:acylphosphatase
MMLKRCGWNCGRVGMQVALALLFGQSVRAQTHRVGNDGQPSKNPVANTGETNVQVRTSEQPERVVTNALPIAGTTLKRIHVFINGRVQGVGFRAFTSRKVATLNLKVTGWVRNLPDGRVELVAEGSATDLGRLMAELAKGPPAARIDKVEQTEAAYTGEFKRFQIEP